LFARHATNAPRPGDETGTDGGLPTETTQQPTRRASAPSYTGNAAAAAAAAAVSIFASYQ